MESGSQHGGGHTSGPQADRHIAVGAVPVDPHRVTSPTLEFVQPVDSHPGHVMHAVNEASEAYRVHDAIDRADGAMAQRLHEEETMNYTAYGTAPPGHSAAATRQGYNEDVEEGESIRDILKHMQAQSKLQCKSMLNACEVQERSFKHMVGDATQRTNAQLGEVKVRFLLCEVCRPAC